MNQKTIRYVFTGVILVLLGVAAALLLKKIRPAQTPAVQASAVAPDTKVKGPADAPIQIIEYSDFQCPACKFAEPVINKILSDPDYAGKVRFVYRHFPLSGHQWSGPAHQAAECANQSGKFWEFHDFLYQEQEKWSVMVNPVEAFILYAKELGFSADAFALCLADPLIQKKIEDEKNLGTLMQIRSTPTFFVNNERIVGPIELENRGIDLIRKTLGLPPRPAVPAVVPAVIPQAAALPVLVQPIVKLPAAEVLASIVPESVVAQPEPSASPENPSPSVL